MTFEQLKAKRKNLSLTTIILYCIGQLWRLDATIYFAEKGMHIPFAKEKAFKITKAEWLKLKPG